MTYVPDAYNTDTCTCGMYKMPQQDGMRLTEMAEGGVVHSSRRPCFIDHMLASNMRDFADVAERVFVQPSTYAGCKDASLHDEHFMYWHADGTQRWCPGVKPERANRDGDSQPLPTPNDAEDIQSQVIRDIEERRELGIRRYGTALQPHNGRNALQDLYEELLDGAMYAKQALIEGGVLAQQLHSFIEFVAEVGETIEYTPEDLHGYVDVYLTPEVQER